MTTNGRTTKPGKRVRKPLTCGLCAAVLAGSLTAATVSTGVASAQGIPNLAYKGTITMYAANYNPPIKGVTPPPGALTDTVTAQAAAAFEKMYPNIKIQFVPGSAEIGTGSYYISESAAGALPDIDEVPGYYVNVTLPFGIFQDLLPSFAKPNPYIPGNKSWISTMNPVALHIDSAPGNTPGSTGIFVVNGDWGGIGFYYNKNLFKEAGIAAPPTTWNQLQLDSTQIVNRLGSKGVYAGASFSPVIYNWFAHYFQANYLGAAKMKLIFSIPSDLSAGYQSYFYDHDGSWLNPAKNPALTAWWPLGKELMATWDPKDVDVPENTAPTIPNGIPMFLGQQVAYTLVSGYSIPNQVAALPKSQQFPVGYFELNSPNAFKGTAPYATNLQTWQDNGGPETAFQFAIASAKSDKSMTPAKTQAATAFLQFISTPKWDSSIVNKEGNALPIISGATAPAALEPIDKALAAESGSYYPMALFDSVTSSSFNTIDGLYLEYVDGYISLQKAVQEYDKDSAQIIQQFNSSHSLLVSNTAKYFNKKLGLK
jgi:raffinose/stachyose/melibiose transport system substrate-binding protein